MKIKQTFCARAISRHLHVFLKCFGVAEHLPTKFCLLELCYKKHLIFFIDRFLVAHANVM